MADNQDNPGIRVPPTFDLPAASRIGVAARHKVARPLLAAQCGASSRMAAHRRRGTALEVVLFDDARSRCAGTYRQAGAQTHNERAVPLQNLAWPVTCRR